VASLKKASATKSKKIVKPVAKKAAAKKTAVKKVGGKKAGAVKKAVAAPKTTVRKVAAKVSAKVPAGPFGIPEQLRDAALKVLSERQAEDIVTVSLAGRSSVADYMIIASGRAGRQVVAISDYLREAFMKLGVKQVRIEGLGEANWVLVDGGDVIVHLFRPEVRSYYDLDAIWNGKRPPQ
jgi:ribosome-associated protein